MANNGAAITLTDKENDVLKQKTIDKVKALNQEHEDNVNKELKDQQQKKDIDNRINKSAFQLGVDARNNTLASIDNTELPDDTSLDISSNKASVFNQLLYNQEKELAASNLKGQQDAETYRLEAEQAKRKAKDMYWQGYDSLAADAVFSGGKSLSNVYKAAYNLDIGLDADLNVNIPRNLNDALEKNDLATRHRNEQIDLATQITAKHLNTEYNNLEEGLKLGFKNLIARSTSLYPAQFMQEEQAMIDAFSATVKDRGDYTKSVDGGFNALLSGTARLADDIYNLARSAAMSANEGKIVASHHTPWANMLQNWFGFSYTPSESMLSEAKYNSLDKFSWGYAALTLIESAPEMAMLWAGLPSGFKNLSLFGKGSLSALKTVSDTTIARAQKALYKKASIVEASGASGAREAAQTLRALADDLPKKFSVGTARNSAMLKSINSALEGAGTTGIRASTLTRNEFARMAGKLAGYAHIGKLGTSAARYTKGTLSSLPIKFLTFDWARRTIMLAGQRGDGSEVTWEDAGLAAIHQWVDVASLLGGLNAFTRPFNPTNSGRQFLAALGIDTVGGAAIEGFGEVYQTYLEQAAKSGHTIPYDWMTLLNLDVGPYKKVGEEMALAGLLGAAGGAMLGGASSLLAPVTEKISDTIDKTRKNLWDKYLDKFGKDVTDTTDPSLGGGDAFKITDISTWADEDIAKATKARESTEASMKKAAEEFEKTKAKFGAGSKEAMAAEKKVKDIEDELKTREQKEQEAIDRKKDIEAAKEKVEESYKKAGINPKTAKRKKTGETYEKYYSSQQDSVERELRDEQTHLEALKAEPTPDAAAIKASEEKIKALKDARDNLEYLRVQHSSQAFEDTVEKEAMASAIAKGKSKDDIEKLKGAFEKARKAKSFKEYNKAMQEIAKIAGDKKMYRYMHKVMHKDSVSDKVTDTGIVDNETGSADTDGSSAKPTGVSGTSTTSSSSGTSATSSTSSSSSKDLDNKIYEDALSQLDGLTIAAIIALHKAADSTNYANLYEDIESNSGISTRVKEFMRAHTFAAIDKSLFASTSGRVTDKRSSVEALNKGFDVSRYELMIVDNEIVTRIDNSTGIEEVDFIRSDTRTLDFLNNPLQQALNHLQQGQKEAIDQKLETIKNLLQGESTLSKQAELTNEVNALNNLFKTHLTNMYKNANMLNYLLSRMSEDSITKIRLRQVYQNTERELKHQTDEMKKIYTDVRQLLKLKKGSTTVTIDPTIAPEDDLRQLIVNLSGVEEDGIQALLDEDSSSLNTFAQLLAKFSATTSDTFAGIRAAINNYNNLENDEQKKAARVKLARIFVKIGRVLKDIVDFNNSDEMVDLYSKVIAMLNNPGIEYALQHQTENMIIELFGEKVKLNPKIPFLRLKMAQLFSGFFGRMYTADIIDTLLPKMINFDRIVTRKKTTDADGKVTETLEINEEALRALSNFKEFFKYIKFSYSKKTQRFISLATANIEEQELEDIVHVNLAEILWPETSEKSVDFPGISQRAVDILGTDIVKGKSAPEIKLLVLDKILNDDKNNFSVRLKEAISSPDPEVRGMIEKLDLMLDMGLLMQAYQMTHSSPDEHGTFSPFINDEQFGWVRGMFDDTAPSDPSTIRDFYNIALALANEYGETKNFDGEQMIEIGKLIKSDGSESYAQGFNPAPGLKDALNDAFRKDIDDWIEILTAKTVVSNNVDDIILTISESGLPVNRKLEFINELQTLGKQFDDETEEFIEKIIGKKAKDVLLKAMENKSNVLDADAYNKLKQEFIDADSSDKRYNILKNGKSFFGNYIGFSVTENHRYTYKDKNGNTKVGNYQTKEFKYVYIPDLAMHIEQDTKTGKYKLVANNDNVLNKWIEELDNSNVKNQEDLLHTLLHSTNITPSTAKTKADEVNNSVLDAIESVNRELGFFMYGLTNRAMHKEGGVAGKIYKDAVASNNTNIQSILNDPINYDKDIFYRYQMQPDGRISAVSSDIQGNKLSRMLKSHQPTNFFTIEDLEKIDQITRKFKGNKKRIMDELKKAKMLDNSSNKLIPHGALNEASTQYGFDSHGIENKAPKDLNDFSTNENYKYIRYNQLLALARVFGLDPEKFTSKKTVSYTRFGVSHSYIAKLTLSSKTKDNVVYTLDKRLGIGKSFSRYLNTTAIRESGSRYEFDLELDITQLYNDMLSDDANIRKIAANVFFQLTNNDDIRGSLGLDELTFRGDHQYQSLRDQKAFKDAIVRDAADNITDINVHKIDNRRFSLYFDGTSTLYFQYGIRFLENILGNLVSGVAVTEDGAFTDLGFFEAKEKLEKTIRKWIEAQREFIKDDTNHNITEDALKKLEDVLNKKGIDGHTLPLFLFAASHAHLTNVSFLVDTFINSENLGDRNSIKKVMTPLGYNAAIQSMINSVHESLRERINPTLSNVFDLAVRHNARLNIVKKNGESSTLTLREMLHEINVKKDDSEYSIDTLKNVFTRELVLFAKDVADNGSTYGLNKSQTDVLKRFSSYYDLDSRPGYFNSLKEAIFDQNIFSTINNNDTYWSDRLNLNTLTRFFNGLWENENREISQYSKHFGGVLANGSMPTLDREALRYANNISRLLDGMNNEGKSDVNINGFENALIFHEIIKKEWIEQILRFKRDPENAFVKIEANGSTYHLRFGRKDKTSTLASTKDFSDLDLYIDPNGSSSKDISKMFADIMTDFKKEKSDILGNLNNLSLSESAESNFLNILSNLIKFQAITGNNLQEHVPIGLATNPLLMLPREVADRVKSNMSISYTHLLLELISVSSARYLKFREEWTQQHYNSIDPAYIKEAEASGIFKAEWDRVNEQLMRNYIDDYLTKLSWSKDGGYVSPYTRNPSAEMRQEHYDTVNKLTEMLAGQIGINVLKSQGAVSSNSMYSMLTNFGKKNSIIPPGTNALFNQPFEAFVVSQMRGIDNQTFDAVESNGVVFSKHLEIWNQENRLYTMAFDSANIAYKALRQIGETTSTIIQGIGTEHFHSALTDTTVDRLLNDSTSPLDDASIRTDYLIARLNFLATTIDTLVHYSQSELPEYSSNAKFATPEHELGGVSHATQAEKDKFVEDYYSVLQQVLKDYYDLINKIKTKDGTDIYNKIMHYESDFYTNLRTSSTGTILPNIHSLLLTGVDKTQSIDYKLTKDKSSDMVAYIKEIRDNINAIKKSLENSARPSETSNKIVNTIEESKSGTLLNPTTLPVKLDKESLIHFILNNSIELVKRLFGKAQKSFRFLKPNKNTVIVDLSSDQSFFDNKIIDSESIKNLVNNNIDAFVDQLLGHFTIENKSTIRDKIVEDINSITDPSNKISADDLVHIVLNRVLQQELSDIVGVNAENIKKILGESPNIDELNSMISKTFKEIHSQVITQSENTTYKLMFMDKEIGTIDLVPYLDARYGMYNDVASEFFGKDLYKGDRERLENKVKNIQSQRNNNNLKIIFVSTLNENSSDVDFTNIRSIYNQQVNAYFLPPINEGDKNVATLHDMIVRSSNYLQKNKHTQTTESRGKPLDEGYGAKPGSSSPTSSGGSSISVTQEQLQQDINNDIDQMISENPDIADELGIVKTLVGSIWNRLVAGLRVFYNNFSDERKGFFGFDNVIKIWSNADEYTRLHEFIHAVTHFASHHPSNKVNILMSRLHDLQQQVKRELDVNEKGISAEEKIKRQQLRNRIEMSDEEFNYMFADTDSYSVHALSEFIAAFMSEPKKIRYLSQLMVQQSFPSAEGKNVYTTTLNGISASAEYLAKAVGQSLKGNKGLSAFALMSQTIFELSQYNNEEGRKQMLEQEEGKTVNKINKQIVGFAKDILGRVSKEDFAKATGITDVNAEMNRLFDEYIERDETINAMIRYGHTLRSIENPVLKNFALAGWLLGTFVIKAANFFNQNPIQREAINEAVQQVRELVLEKTFFDTLIKLDFGVYPTQFLKDNVNLINRAASLRNSYDFQENQARNILEQQVRDIIDGDQAIKDILDKSPEFREKYETALFRAIQFSNIGDYFLFNEEDINSSKIDQAEVSKLARLMLNVHKNDKVALNECRELAKQKRAAAFEALGIKEDAVKKSISKLVIDLAKARNSDETNRFNTSNIEMGLKQLGFKEWNRQAFNALHQAITLEAIAYPYRKGNERDANSVHVKETRKALVEMQTLAENPANPDEGKLQKALTQSIENLIRLHAQKTRQVNNTRVLNYKTIDRFLKPHFGREKFMNKDLYLLDTSDKYHVIPAFEMRSMNAYNLDSHKFYKYNKDRDIVPISPEDPPVPQNIREELASRGLTPKDLSVAEKQKYFKWAKENYKAKGYKPIAVNGMTGDKAKYVTDSGVEIWAFDNKWYIDQKTHREERMFIKDNYSHKGRISYILNSYEYQEQKDSKNIEYSKAMHEQLLDYGKDYTDDYIPKSGEVAYGSRLKTKGGSSTILQVSNLTAQEFEHITDVSTSIVDAFGEMESQIHKNKIREFYNDQIFYHVIQMDKQIRNRPYSLDSSYNHEHHHTEVLFTRTDDEGKTPKWNFNKSLIKKYGLNMSPRDEEAFAKLWVNIPESEKGKITDGNIYVDSRLIPIMFGREKFSPEEALSDSNPTLYKVSKTFKSIWQSLLAEFKNTIIIRNPKLIYINAMGNFAGLIGEGIPVADAAESWSHYANELNRYNKDVEQKFKIENTLSIFERDFSGVRDSDKYQLQMPDGSVKEISGDQYKRLVDSYKRELNAVQQRIELNPVHPLVKAGFYSNLIEDSDSSTFKWWDAGVEWVIKNLELDEKRAYALKEVAMTEDSDIYKTAGHLTRMGDFIPRVVLYYHLRDRGLSHPEALDEARNRFVNYNTPMWSNTMYNMEQAGLVMFSKYRMAVQYQILQAFKNAPLQASAMLGTEMLLEASGIRTNPLTSYLGEIGSITPSGVLSNGLESVLSNGWRWKFIEQFSDDVDNVLGLAS